MSVSTWSSRQLAELPVRDPLHVHKFVLNLCIEPNIYACYHPNISSLKMLTGQEDEHSPQRVNVTIDYWH